MAHVHKLGIVHQDLKPANILLDAQQRPRIADFGYCGGNRVTSSTTGYGTIIYMSPEQRKGQKAHPADDVYALGVILWQMLAGQLEALESEDDIKDCRRRRDKRISDAAALLALITPLPLAGEDVG